MMRKFDRFTWHFLWCVALAMFIAVEFFDLVLPPKLLSAIALTALMLAASGKLYGPPRPQAL